LKSLCFGEFVEQSIHYQIAFRAIAIHFLVLKFMANLQIEQIELERRRDSLCCLPSGDYSILEFVVGLSCSRSLMMHAKRFRWKFI